MSGPVLGRVASRLPSAAWPLAALLAFAAIGPLLAPQDPNAQDLLRVMEAPSARHPLGTDHVGRDILSRVLAGAPHSLGLASLCVGIAASLGLSFGLVAARSRPWLRATIMRLADMMLAGKLHVPIQAIIPFQNAPEALSLAAQPHRSGKILLDFTTE